MSKPSGGRKRTTRPIDGWEDHAVRVKKQRLSEDSVRGTIQGQHVQDEEPIVHVKVSLKSSGFRIDVPVRSKNCKHAQCFDLANYLKDRDRNLLDASKKFITWKCPICSASAEVHELRIDGYFEAVLRKYADMQNIDEVEILSDGSYRPAVQPKVEVVPVSDSPFIPPEEADNDDEKSPTSQAQDPSSQDESSCESVENTDLDLDAIIRLPETNQLCKDAKRKLLRKFKRDKQRKKREAEEAMNDPTTAVADEVDDGAASAQADDVDDSSSEGGSALETSSTLTALSRRLQQRPSEVTEGIVGPTRTSNKLRFDNDSSDSELDEHARDGLDRPTRLHESVNTDVETMNDLTTVADEVDDGAASTQADDVDDSSPSETSQDITCPKFISLFVTNLRLDDDSPESECHAPARGSQSPTSLQEIVNTGMLNDAVSDASQPL